MTGEETSHKGGIFFKIALNGEWNDIDSGRKALGVDG